MRTGPVILVTACTAVIVSSATFFTLRALQPGGHPTAGTVEVPPVTGIRPDQARKLLEPRELSLLISDQREDSRTEAGLIAQQSPIEGSRVHRGSEVRVILSTGPARVEVPPLVRMPLTSAMQILSGAGLRPGKVTRQPSTEVPTEQVIASIPAAGERLPRGSLVSLTVSEGTSLPEVVVPTLVGRSREQATGELARIGLKAGKVTYGYDEDRRGGVVIRQEPAAGSRAPRGSPVSLVVNETD